LTDLGFDSVRLAIQDRGKLLQNLSFTRGKKDTYTRDLTINDNTSNGKLNPYQRYTLSFPFPITSSDQSKIILLEDSVKRTNFQLIKDTTDFLKYYIVYPWKVKKPYDIKFLAGSFTAIFNTKNKDVSKRFNLETTDSYGTLTLKVEIPDSTKTYIVEFIDEKKNPIKSSVITKNGTINFANYPAGKYFIRVIYDDNKNGIWDTGDVKSGVQPEKIWYSTTEMSLRANWEREDKLSIPLTPPEIQETTIFQKKNDEQNQNGNSGLTAPPSNLRKN
ncbi:MAG: hypothetical protein ABWZ79_09040, partial [Pedobacter agri]